MAVSLNKPVVCPVLIGRASDLAILHTLIDEAKNGNGQVLLVAGEAGIGKSRLVREAKTYAAQLSMSILQGNCFESDHSYPYAPLIDLLRTILVTHAPEDLSQSSDSLAHELIKLLPELDNELLDVSMLSERDPEQEKRRLFAALAQFFISQAAKQPVLLIVEDLHWCDDTSLEFLLYLARRCTRQPILMILTYRNDEDHASLRHCLAQLERERLAQELALARLSQNDVEAMLNAIFNKRYPVHLDLLNFLYTLTEGNPFFIEEILKSLIVAGELVFTDGRWVGRPLNELHIPRSIQDAVQQRTDQLSEGARHVLILAAVAGRRFDFALLQQLTPHDEKELLGLMKELIAAQLVVEESADQFAFRHALTRQAIYAELLARERRALHKAIAETIERLYTTTLDAYLGVLAYHFYKAEVWGKAFQYGQLAGEKAQVLYSPRAAIEQYTQALRAAQRLQILPSATLYRRRGQAYETLGDFEQAQSDYKQALNIAQNAHDGVEALRYHREALTIFQELHDQHGIAEALDLLGMTSYLGGDLVQGTAYYEQAIALFRELDDRHGLTSSLATLALRGPTYQTDAMVSAATSLAEVIQDTEKALQIAREIDQRPAEAYALFQLALCLGSQGEYTHAFESAQRSLEIAEEIEHQQWQTAAHTILGGMYSGLLVLPQAREHFERALALAHEIGSLFWIRIATGYLASAIILQGDLTRAELILNAALNPQTPAQTMAQRLMWCAQVELALAQGNPARALDITDLLIASDTNTSVEQNILRVSKLRGEALVALQQPAEAEVAFESALEMARVQGVRPMQWRIGIALGNLYYETITCARQLLCYLMRVRSHQAGP